MALGAPHSDTEREQRTLADDTVSLGAFNQPGTPGSDELDAEGWAMHSRIASRLFGTAARFQRIGRYDILRVLGSGGMGVVYEAHDPMLDRRVALKLLREATGVRGEKRRRRLLREAQGLARLSHPNVIQVYEVGSFEERNYISMELVPGLTLEAWQRQERPWRETLDAYVQAARGLAAAHRAGLVHRDFKPANVIVADDGRTRVLDFGLVGELEPSEQLQPGSGKPALPDLGLTRTHELVGTPAFMSPEQALRQPADARSDQFSFCVALYEGVYRQRPFSGRTLEGRLDAMLDGRVGPAPEGSEVPGWLREVLVRGLARAPDERFESMDALLAAIEPHLAPVQKKARGAMWLGLGLAGAAAFGTVAATRSDPCPDPSAELAGVWDATIKANAHAAFTATDLPYADTAWQHVADRLDDYGERWARGRRETCEDTQSRGGQSAEQFDLSVECFERRARQMRVITTTLAAADVEVVDHAHELVASLGNLEACRDAGYLRGQPPAPNPMLAAAVDEVRDSLVRARALETTGRLVDALAVAESAVAEAASLEYSPIRAEARLALAHAQAELQRPISVETYSLALAQAEESGDDWLAVRALIGLTYAAGGVSSDTSGGLRAAGWAEAKLQRVGGHALLEAQLHDARGRTHLVAGDFDAAVRDHREAIALLERETPEDSLGLAKAKVGLANAHRFAGAFEDGLELLHDVKSARAAVLGEEHPEVAETEFSIGLVHYGSGEWEAAKEAYLRSLDGLVRAHGKAGPLVGSLYGALAQTEMELEHPREAVAHAREAAAIQSAHLGPDHDNYLVTLTLLADAQIGTDDHAAAAETLREIIDRWSKTKDDKFLSGHLRRLAGELTLLGRHDEAVPFHRRALAALGSDDPYRAYPLLGLAEGAAAEGNTQRARALVADAEKALVGVDDPAWQRVHDRVAAARERYE